MQFSRRSFLAALGMTGASMAFARPFKAVKGVEDAAVAISEKNGFSLRYLRVYDIREDLYVNRFDMLTA